MPSWCLFMISSIYVCGSVGKSTPWRCENLFAIFEKFFQVSLFVASFLLPYSGLVHFSWYLTHSYGWWGEGGLRGLHLDAMLLFFLALSWCFASHSLVDSVNMVSGVVWLSPVTQVPDQTPDKTPWGYCPYPLPPQSGSAGQIFVEMFPTFGNCGHTWHSFWGTTGRWCFVFVSVFALHCQKFSSDLCRLCQVTESELDSEDVKCLEFLCQTWLQLELWCHSKSPFCPCQKWLKPKNASLSHKPRRWSMSLVKIKH